MLVPLNKNVNLVLLLLSFIHIAMVSNNGVDMVMIKHNSTSSAATMHDEYPD
jgi:hypothetical protein